MLFWLYIQFAQWRFWCCSWSSLDKSSVTTAIWIQRHNLAACLGGLFLVTAVLIIITVAWGALHKHQSVHALVAAINGRWNCEPSHPSDFTESLDQIFNLLFWHFLGFLEFPKNSPLDHHSPHELLTIMSISWAYPFWANPRISHCIPITFLLHCHYISILVPLYPSIMAGPKAKKGHPIDLKMNQ